MTFPLCSSRPFRLRSNLWIALCFLSTALLLTALAARAQVTSGETESGSPSSSSSAPSTREAPETYQPPAATAAEAIAYSRAQHRVYFYDFAYGLLILIVILECRVASRYRDWAERATRRRFLQAVLYTPLLLLTIDIVSLPISIWQQYLEREFHQSIQNWGSWLLDWLKGEALSMILAIFLVWILYAILRRRPQRWWFYFWLASLPILVFLLFISPFVLEPLFFQFTPMSQTQPALARDIEQLVRHGGLDIPQNRIYEMTASAKVQSVNAYVSGIGASKRVVVWDTTIARMTPPEILFVVGHEMGHYVLHHIPKEIAFLAGVLLIFFLLGDRGLRALLAWRGGEWSIRAPDDWASLPILLLLLSVFGFLFTPIDNAVSRYFEHQADQFGLEVIHGIVPDAPVVAARAFEILGEVDLEEPHPSSIDKLWFEDHPSVDERIRFARSYDPWSKGQSPGFVK
ncbi:MAG: M48 family metallopeptidase [Candidatus Acidiferrales bacterium]